MLYCIIIIHFIILICLTFKDMVMLTQIHFRNCSSLCARVLFFFDFFIDIYKADLSIIHCLNVVRCIIAYLKYIIIIMKFQNKIILEFGPSGHNGFFDDFIYFLLICRNIRALADIFTFSIFNTVSRDHFHCSFFLLLWAKQAINRYWRQ